MLLYDFYSFRTAAVDAEGGIRGSSNSYITCVIREEKPGRPGVAVLSQIPEVQFVQGNGETGRVWEKPGPSCSAASCRHL